MALRGINAAINDPSQASTETTLAAILCLSLYEIIAFERPKSIESWLTHTHGAAVLLELRDGEQLQYEGGFDMFSALRNTAADIKDGALRDDTMVLSMAMEIDTKLEEFSRELFANFPFIIGTWNGKNSSVNESRHISHYDGNFHIYTSVEACDIWNSYRSTRILVSSLLLSHLKPSMRCTATPTESHPDQYFNIYYLTKQLAIDICQSVPFKLGLTEHGKKNNQAIEAVQTGAGLTLLYPLYLAAVVDISAVDELS
ncbi:hypothetical protein PENANT_c033G11225 [Penicillium antarcticum]|uniref:Uncharacterized protein n=1 Tax=Penicillium antarcticum TaxID=416450 RepID=A0A1V6PUP4_9EURO|nr:hypothetical protein PENANT_c033G11225 [Penicillium antarcticum]